MERACRGLGLRLVRRCCCGDRLTYGCDDAPSATVHRSPKGSYTFSGVAGIRRRPVPRFRWRLPYWSLFRGQPQMKSISSVWSSLTMTASRSRSAGTPYRSPEILKSVDLTGVKPGTSLNQAMVFKFGMFELPLGGYVFEFSILWRRSWSHTVPRQLVRREAMPKLEMESIHTNNPARETGHYREFPVQPPARQSSRSRMPSTRRLTT